MNAAMASASFFLAIYSMDKKKYKRSKVILFINLKLNILIKYLIIFKIYRFNFKYL